MSASLVGSEMCIRDRVISWAPEALEIQRPKPGVWPQHATGPGGPPMPVSYTHLTLPTICSV
eukprot:1365884-Alexandrium_andersonii.AAC.1